MIILPSSKLFFYPLNSMTSLTSKVLITQFNSIYLTYFNGAFLSTSMVCNWPTSIVPQLPTLKVLRVPKTWQKNWYSEENVAQIATCLCLYCKNFSALLYQVISCETPLWILLYKIFIFWSLCFILIMLRNRDLPQHTSIKIIQKLQST